MKADTDGGQKEGSYNKLEFKGMYMVPKVYMMKKTQQLLLSDIAPYRVW